MFDAVRFFIDYGIPHYFEGKNVSPGWVNVQCPFHSDSNHLGYSPEGYFVCWKCGGHKIEKVIEGLLSCSWHTAKDLARDYTSEMSVRRVLNKKTTQGVTMVIPPGTSLSKHHRRYLKNRNFDPDYIVEKYKITGTGPMEEWKGKNYQLRIIIPIIENGKIISFQGRDITNKQELRYKGCPIELSVKNYKHTLYNLDNCPGTSIRLVEGITDVWRMGDGYAATFGTSISDYQLATLSRYKNIVFLFDPETEAQEKARKGAEKLAAIGENVEMVELTTGCDPGDLTEDQAEKLRKLLM
jgi:hypothetical protein